jgi:hypothetical protein
VKVKLFTLNYWRNNRIMLKNNIAQKKRRLVILEGLKLDLKLSEISDKLGVNRWLIQRDIRYMKKIGDPKFKQAKRVQVELREKKALILTREKEHFKQNERFEHMTGITIQEKSFRNMIDFNKRELLKILKSEDQQAEIIKLPISIQKTLKKNGIITKRWQDNEITKPALEYLTN